MERSSFTFTGSSTADRQFRSLLSYVEYCLKYRKSDPTIKLLTEKFDKEIKNLKQEINEKKIRRQDKICSEKELFPFNKDLEQDSQHPLARCQVRFDVINKTYL